jgi:hypothetical protein
METVDARHANAAVGPSSDQEYANVQLSYAQGTMESIQNIRPDYTSKSLESRSTNADIKDGNPSKSTTDYSKFTQSSAYHKKSNHHQELKQQFNRHTEDSSSFQDVDRFVQP